MSSTPSAAARRRRPGRALARRASSSARARPTPTAASRELADAAARHLPDRLPAPVAVLPPGRARGRARRGPLPRPAARLLVRVRDLPRKLSVEELAELFEGRTRFVERLARARRPARPRPRGRRVALRRREEGGARRAPGDRREGALGAVAAEQGADAAPELDELNRALRGAVRLPLRRLRQPAAEERDRADPARAAASGRASRSSRRRSTSSSRSPRTDGGVPRPPPTTGGAGATSLSAGCT